MPTPSSPQQVRLAARLRELREQTGMSGKRFAETLDWAQSKVWRLENAQQAPRENDIHEWAAATGQGRFAEAELFGLLAAARTGYTTIKETLAGGAAAWQAYIAALEVDSKRICEYQHALVPGLLQTAAYAHELMRLPGGPVSSGATNEDITALVDARIRRQQVLYQPGKRIEFVIGEAALHDPPGTVETLLGQLDRLVAITGLSQVELGVVPLGTRMPIMPIGSFAVQDAEVAWVETFSGEQRLEEPDDVRIYQEAFDALMAAAMRGAAAVALVRRVADELSRPPPT